LEIKSVARKIIERFPEIAYAISRLDENTTFKETINKAGTIGSLLYIGITLFGEIKKSITIPERRAFAIMMKIMLESAEKNLHRSYEISMKEITNSKEEFPR
jgi:hypothetical protein